MKNTNFDTEDPDTEEILNAWKDQNKSNFDEIDITFAVMASLQPLTAIIPEKKLNSYQWLELPSIFTGLLRSCITLFIILTPA